MHGLISMTLGCSSRLRLTFLWAVFIRIAGRGGPGYNWQKSLGDNVQPVIIRHDQIEEIQKFARNFLVGNEMEIEMASWSAPWRTESLDHYLPLGWSFLVRNESELAGFFLAQPLLFFDSHTQVLWVESILAVDDDSEKILIDTAYRLAREKHLQRVVFPDETTLSSVVPERSLQPFAVGRKQVATVKT